MKELHVPVSTTQCIIKKSKMFNTVKNLNGRGKKHKVSCRVPRKICCNANNNSVSPPKLNQARKTVLRFTVQQIFKIFCVFGEQWLPPWCRVMNTILFQYLCVVDSLTEVLCRSNNSFKDSFFPSFSILCCSSGVILAG